MQEEPTTSVIQRYLDALPDDPAAEPIIRELLDRAVGRLRLLCATQLHRRYPRLAQPPVNLETDELLGGVVAGLLTAVRTVRPQSVRQFFALACQHMRWQLNDLARRLDEQPAVAALAEVEVTAPPSSTSSGLIFGTELRLPNGCGRSHSSTTLSDQVGKDFGKEDKRSPAYELS
jgi:RNA polymerase sigma-70 factor (ECF subfamily)